MQEIIHRNPKLNLDIIDAGPSLQNPMEVLSGGRIGEFLSFLESTYEIRIINGPPVSQAAEALDLARRMKGIILVVDSSSATMKSLKTMQEIFEGKNLPIMGIVVNKAGAGRI